MKGIRTEIMTLKRQESIILAVLIDEVKTSSTKIFDRKSWTEFLKNMKFTEEECTMWHQAFEEDSPVEHVAFLCALGMSDKEI